MRCSVSFTLSSAWILRSLGVKPWNYNHLGVGVKVCVHVFLCPTILSSQEGKLSSSLQFLSLEMEFFEGQRKEHLNLRLED